ncbi:MAG: hypothetical protein EKK40_15840 [Bradyrhizobiaceae bacterium]|nr:MAG: hypothetical protein EKK40_15840 [Bradyrhizobiaceae bacterium]
MAKNSRKKKRPAAKKPSPLTKRRAVKSKSAKKKNATKKKPAKKTRKVHKKLSVPKRNTRKAARPTQPLTKAKTDKTYTGRLDSSVLPGIAPHTSRREIYYRLEWYFLGEYLPNKVHRIDPAAPISSLLRGIGLADLCYNMNLEENRSKYFNGVRILWDSPPPPKSFKNVKSFGELLDSVVADYRIAGFVIDGE